MVPLSPLPFASLLERRVACSWKVVVLYHPCDRSFCLAVTSFRLPSLREEWLVFVVGGGSRSPG